MMDIYKESHMILEIFTNKVALIIDQLEFKESDMNAVNLVLRQYSDGFITFAELVTALEKLTGV